MAVILNPLGQEILVLRQRPSYSIRRHLRYRDYFYRLHSNHLNHQNHSKHSYPSNPSNYSNHWNHSNCHRYPNRRAALRLEIVWLLNVEFCFVVINSPLRNFALGLSSSSSSSFSSSSSTGSAAPIIKSSERVKNSRVLSSSFSSRLRLSKTLSSGGFSESNNNKIRDLCLFQKTSIRYNRTPISNTQTTLF